MMKYLRVNKEYSFLVYCMLFIYLELPIFTISSSMILADTILNYAKIAMLFLLIIKLLVKKYNLNLLIPVLYITLIWLIPFVQTILNSGDIRYVITSYFITISFCLWIYVYLTKDFYRTIRCIANYLCIVVFCDLISRFLMPNGIVEGTNMFGTDSSHWILGGKNHLCTFALPAFILALITGIYYKNKKYFLSAIMCAFAIIISKSSTGIIGLSIVVIILIAFIFFGKKHKVAVILNINTYIVVAIVIGIIFYIVGSISIFSFIIVEILQKDITLTTRVVIWNKVIEMIKENILFGHGFLETSRLRILFRASHQHSMYLRMLFNGGFFTLGAFALLMNKCRQILKKNSFYTVSIMLSAGIFAFLIMFISEVYAENLYLLPFFGLLMIVLGSQGVRQEEF